MPRNISSNQINAIRQAELGVLLLIHAELKHENVRYSSHNGRVKWKGDTYLGAGNLLRLDVISSTSEISAQSFRLGLSYLAEQFDPSTLTRDDFLGRPIRMWFAPFQTDGAVSGDDNTDPRIKGDPILILDGYLDEDTLRDAPDGGTLDFRCINKMDVLTRASNLLYTDESQKDLYGQADSGLENIASIQDYVFEWGRDPYWTSR